MSFNKKYKSKSKKNKLERSRLQKFFFRDISHFPYEKEAVETATFITIILLIVLFFYIIFEFDFKSRDLLGKMLRPVEIATFFYSNIFSILLCWDIFLFLVNKIFVLLDKKSSNYKELCKIKQNLLKTDIKEKVYDICKGIVFKFAYLIFLLVSSLIATIFIRIIN